MSMPRRVFVDDLAVAPRSAIWVGPQSKWANPFSFLDVGGQYPSLDDQQLANMVVRHFSEMLPRGSVSFPNWRFFGGHRGPVTFTYPIADEIRAELAGTDLACNCPLAEACHADVLLKIANITEGAPAE